MKKRAKILYVCPWSLNDPLCQSQTLAYLRGLVKLGYGFALITLEQPKYAVADVAATRADLAAEDIEWHPIAYYQSSSLLTKSRHYLGGIAVGARICATNRPLFVHARSSHSTLTGAALSQVFRLKFLYDADSMLSEEYADVGHWSRQSRGYKAMAAAENLARRTAARIIVLSETLKRDLQTKYQIHKEIDVIPCCVNTANFRFDAAARQTIRGELGLRDDEKLLVYVGKIGRRYKVEETFDFFRAARKRCPSLKLLIVSPDAPADFIEIARGRGVDYTAFSVVAAAHYEVGRYLSAADAGLALINSSSSERGASPVKIAEYLACNLPVVMTDGIGDLSEFVDQNRVGAIVRGLSASNYQTTFDALENLWREPDLRDRCRLSAVEHFSVEAVGVRRYAEIYRQLLG